MENRTWLRSDLSVLVKYRIAQKGELTSLLYTIKNTGRLQHLLGGSGFKLANPLDTIETTRSENISGGGLLLKIPKLEVGTILALDIEIPTLPRAVYALGKVVWAGGESAPEGEAPALAKHGVQFSYIEERDQDAIARYISENERQSRRQQALSVISNE